MFKLFAYSRFEADAACCNLSNMFVYSFPVMAQKMIADANFSIPYKWREGDYFSTQLTNLFDASLLNFPIYSHHHVLIYDPKTRTVRETAPYRLKMAIRKLILHTPLFSTAQALYHKLHLHSRHKSTHQNQTQAVPYMLNSKLLSQAKTIHHATSPDKMRIQPQIAARFKIFDTLL